MISDRALSDWIGKIYDCSMDQGLWPGVLGELCQIMNGHVADIVIMNPIDPTVLHIQTYNWDAEAVKYAQDHMHLNPAAPLAMVHPLDEPFCGSRHTDMEAVHRSRYFHPFYSRRGHYDIVIGLLSRTLTRVGMWEVVGHVSRGVFTDQEIDFARMITPHIRRAVDISGLLADRKVIEGTLRGALDAIAAAAFIVAPDGTIRYRNGAADAELRLGTVVAEVKGRLVGRKSELSRVIAALADPAQSAQRGRDVHVTDETGRSLHITWVQLDHALAEADAPFLVVLRSPEPELTTPVAAASRLFGLTGSETMVLAQVLEGRSLEEAAELIGVARSTVKTHLDSIFAKSGVRRQTELVRKVMGLISPVG